MKHFLVFAFFAATSAQVTLDGPCPDVKPMDNFDFSAYKGTWYEIARYPNEAEKGNKGKCTTAEFIMNGDKSKVINSHVIDGVKSHIEGVITHADPGKLKLTYTFGGRSKDSYLTVLKTDYKNYAIGYSCKDLKDTKTHQVFSWIMSRSKTLDSVSMDLVKDYVKSSSVLDAQKYENNDFSEVACSHTDVKEIKEFLD